jgi:hypothetical protein
VMENLTYHEADRKALEDSLLMSESVWNWWIVAKVSSESDRELARTRLDSIHRLQEAIKVDEG